VSVAAAAARFTIEARCSPHALAKSVTAAVLLHLHERRSPDSIQTNQLSTREEVQNSRFFKPPPSIF